jgi:hypothetical protein
LFASGISAQRNTLSIQKSSNQLSYVAEYMGRALRQAQKDVGGTCITAKKNFEIGGGELRFLDKNTICRSFLLESEQLKERLSLGGPAEPLTPDGMKVTNFQALLMGEAQTDNLQPRVTFVIEAEGEGSNAPIRIQTTISQRNFDVVQ